MRCPAADAEGGGGEKKKKCGKIRSVEMSFILRLVLIAHDARARSISHYVFHVFQSGKRQGKKSGGGIRLAGIPLNPPICEFCIANNELWTEIPVDLPIFQIPWIAYMTDKNEISYPRH